MHHPFFGRTTTGQIVSLNTWLGRPLILYFFHKAFTPNCTVETKGFRDNYDELRAIGYDVLGLRRTLAADSVRTPG